MSRLVDAANTLVPAILLLLALGFEVERLDLESRELWIATRGDLVLQAGDPLRLLGLARLWESRGPDWRASDADIAAVLSNYYSPDAP